MMEAVRIGAKRGMSRRSAWATAVLPKNANIKLKNLDDISVVRTERVATVGASENVVRNVPSEGFNEKVAAPSEWATAKHADIPNSMT